MTLPRGEGARADGYQFYADPHNGVPAIHALLIVDGRVLAAAMFIRGARGYTNFTAQAIDGTPEEIVRAFESGEKWILSPWLESDEADGGEER